jgi:formylmethanofuran dehydrogenase subunit E
MTPAGPPPAMQHVVVSRPGIVSPFEHHHHTRKLLQDYDKVMDSFDDLLKQAEIAHGHLCAGQILGVRMAMLGCARLGIEEPRGKDRKRLVTYIEIDRCATDAIGVVTGCRLGKRALKFRDWGKMAATFVDLASNRAIRISAKESSKALARQMYPDIENKNQQQMLAYRELNDSDLFDEQWVRVTIEPKEFPGFKGERIACDLCGEGINYDRFIRRNGQTLCLSCATPEERYYQPL